MISRRSFAIASLSLAAARGALAAEPPQWKGGTHYLELDPPLPKQISGQAIEVLEFFWYGCPHCYTTEPHLVLWERKKPADVEFVHVPVMLGADIRIAHGRLYYALHSLRRDDLHGQVFDTIHRLRRPLEKLDDQLKFAAANGIAPKNFEQAYQSAETPMNQAEALAKSYRVDGIPTMTVNGKYLTTLRRAGGESQLITLINHLVERERSSAKSSAKS